MKYSVNFTVEGEALAILLAVLEKESRIVLGSLSALPDQSPKTKSMKYANGKRLKDISGKQLILDMTKGGVAVTRDQLLSAFLSHGFANNSMHAALSNLRREKLVDYDKNRNIRRLPTPKGAN